MDNSLHTTLCPVCLETTLNKNVTKTRCCHKFCFHCLYLSLQYQRTCPMCRANITPLINEDYTLYCNMMRLYGKDYKSHPNWKIAKTHADKLLLTILATNNDLYADGKISDEKYNRTFKYFIMASLRLDFLVMTHMIALLH